MAARRYEQFNYTLEKDVVTIFAKIQIGAIGAVVPIVQHFNKGILSVVRNSTGNYTITFGQTAQNTVDAYQRLLDMDAQILLPSISAVADVQVFNDNAQAGNIIIQCISDAGAAVDPDNGAFLILRIVLKNGVI